MKHPLRRKTSRLKSLSFSALVLNILMCTSLYGQVVGGECYQLDRLEAPEPKSILEENVFIYEYSGPIYGYSTTPSSMEPNTTYKIRVVQNPFSNNSHWVINANEGSGYLEANQSISQDAAPWQSSYFYITTDSSGNGISFLIYGGSGGGAYQLCYAQPTTIEFN